MRKPLKIALIVSFIIVLFIALVIGLATSIGKITDEKREVAKKDMRIKVAEIETKLEKKYEKDFTWVDSSQSWNAGFGTTSYYYFKCEEDGLIFGYSGGEDSYLFTKWSKEGRKYIDAAIKEVYTEDYQFEFSLSMQPKNAVGMEKMNYDEAVQYLKENKDEKIGSASDMICYVFVDGTINKEDEAIRIFELLMKCKFDKEVGGYLFAVYYINKNHVDEVDLNELSHYSPEYRKELHDKNIIINGVGFRDNDQIEAVNDIYKQFVY